MRLVRIAVRLGFLGALFLAGKHLPPLGVAVMLIGVWILFKLIALLRWLAGGS